MTFPSPWHMEIWKFPIHVPKDDMTGQNRNLVKLVKTRCFCLTPRKFNMEPQNEGLEDVFPFQMGDFQVPCYNVSFRGCTVDGSETRLTY